MLSCIVLLINTLTEVSFLAQDYFHIFGHTIDMRFQKLWFEALLTLCKI